LETLNKVVELRDTMRMRGGKLKIAVQLSLGFALVCVSLGEIRARAGVGTTISAADSFG
jgi:hypothetical protein